MKSKIPLPVIIFGFVVLFFYLKSQTKSNENRVDDTTITTTDAVSKPEPIKTESVHTENTESIYSGNRCAECRKRCKKNKEMYSSGDAMSSYEPYYLCGDMDCVNRRYAKDKRMQRYEQQEQEYRNADEGRLNY